MTLKESDHPIVQRYLAVLLDLCDNDDEHTGFAIGCKLGLSLGVHHPEYALALQRILNEHWGPTNSKDACDAFIERLPLEEMPVE